jgi:hypothetical protein
MRRASRNPGNRLELCQLLLALLATPQTLARASSSKPTYPLPALGKTPPTLKRDRLLPERTAGALVGSEAPAKRALLMRARGLQPPRKRRKPVTREGRRERFVQREIHHPGGVFDPSLERATADKILSKLLREPERPWRRAAVRSAFLSTRTGGLARFRSCTEPWPWPLTLPADS